MAVAFFDMDGTLINSDTNQESLDYYRDIGLIDNEFRARFDGYARDFMAGKLKVLEFVRYIVSPLLNLPADKTKAILDNAVNERILPKVFPGAKREIEARLAAGDTPVLVTSTVNYLAGRVAEGVGIAHVIAAPVIFKDGCVTQELSGEVPYQDGKVRLIKAFIKERGLSFEGSYAYGDTVNDLPMLACCEHRYAVNPSPGLKNHPDFKTLTEVDWKN